MALPQQKIFTGGLKVIITASPRGECEESAARLKELYPDSVVESGSAPRFELARNLRGKLAKICWRGYPGEQCGCLRSMPFTEYTEREYIRPCHGSEMLRDLHNHRAASECMIAKAKRSDPFHLVHGHSGQASGLAYPTSKFAVNGLTVSLAREPGPKGDPRQRGGSGDDGDGYDEGGAKHGIRGAADPPAPSGQARGHIANAFVFLASEEASYTGVVLSVDGMARL